MERFGKLLRRQRTEAGKSSSEVARHLGISVVYLSDIERSRRDPFAPEKIIDVAKFLGVDPDPLLSSAVQDRGRFSMEVTDYPEKAIDLLNTLARGRRPKETYQKLLDVLRQEDERRGKP